MQDPSSLNCYRLGAGPSDYCSAEWVVRSSCRTSAHGGSLSKVERTVIQKKFWRCSLLPVGIIKRPCARVRPALLQAVPFVPFPTANDISPLPPPFTHLYHSNWRPKSVPPPSLQPSQRPHPNTELPNAAPQILPPARQNRQYRPQNNLIIPHSPPQPTQLPTQMNRNDRK